MCSSPIQCVDKLFLCVFFFLLHSVSHTPLCCIGTSSVRSSQKRKFPFDQQIFIYFFFNSTAVQCACVGNFTAGNERNLLVAKGNRIEGSPALEVVAVFAILNSPLVVMLLSDDSVVPLLVVPVHAAVSAMCLFRPTQYDRDLLAIVSELGQFCVLQFDASSETDHETTHTQTHTKFSFQSVFPCAFSPYHTTHVTPQKTNSSLWQLDQSILVQVVLYKVSNCLPSTRSTAPSRCTFTRAS